MFMLIVSTVCVLAMLVAGIAAVYAMVTGRKARMGASEATARAAAYSAMKASWAKQADECLYLDAAIRDAQVNLGLRSVGGTVLGYSVRK